MGDPLITIDQINTDAKYSDTTTANYSATFIPTYYLNPASFLYVKARKEHAPVNNLNLITTDGIYVHQGSLTIDNSNPISNATASKFVLIVEGDVTINQVTFNIDNADNDCIGTSTPKNCYFINGQDFFCRYHQMRCWYLRCRSH